MGGGWSMKKLLFGLVVAAVGVACILQKKRTA